jgi:uncharacterized OB-fold protein
VKGIRPAIRVESAEFWRFVQEREFRAQRCANCAVFRWPPAPICFRCWSFDSTWEPLSREGLLRSWVTFHREYFPEFPIPYTVGLVELPEGIRYPSLLRGREANQCWRYEETVSLAFADVETMAGERMLLPLFEAAHEPQTQK